MPGPKIANALQTNATLISEALAAHLAQRDFEVLARTLCREYITAKLY